MTTKSIVQKIETDGIIPVLTIKHKDTAVEIVRALLEGGLKSIEVTLRTDSALDAIKQIKKIFPNIIVGAGTVTNLELFKSALDAGADFFVSPGLDENLVKYSHKVDQTIFPGVLTPSEITRGLLLGIEIFKFFPSEAYGGINTIKALNGPFPNIRFIPTGGISLENLSSYISNKSVVAVGGSWLVKTSWVDEKNFHEITKCAHEALELIQHCRKEN